MTIREFAIVFVLLLPVPLGIFLLQKSRVFAGWRRACVKATSAFLVVVSLLALLMSAYARSGSRPAPVFSVEAPGGGYIARVIEPDGDLIPTRYVRVAIRVKGHFLAHEVFKGAVEPNIDWLDSRTLQLTYPEASKETFCGGSWSGVSVVCKQVTISEFKPRLRV